MARPGPPHKLHRHCSLEFQPSRLIDELWSGNLGLQQPLGIGVSAEPGIHTEVIPASSARSEQDFQALKCYLLVHQLYPSSLH